MTTAPETDGLSPRMTAVLAHVAQHPAGVRAEQVAAGTGLDETTARTYLRRLTDAGRITRVVPGLYAPRPIHETPEDTVPDTAIDPTDLDTDETLVIELGDEPDDQVDHERVGGGQEPAVPGSLADELAQAQARADRLRAQVTAAQEAEERKRQERQRAWWQRQVDEYDPAALTAQRDAAHARLAVEVEAHPLMAALVGLPVLDRLHDEQTSRVRAAADQLGVPHPPGSDRRFDTFGGPVNNLQALLGQLILGVSTARLEQERAEAQEAEEAYVEGEGEQQ